MTGPNGARPSIWEAKKSSLGKRVASLRKSWEAAGRPVHYKASDLPSMIKKRQKATEKVAKKAAKRVAKTVLLASLRGSS